LYWSAIGCDTIVCESWVFIVSKTRADQDSPWKEILRQYFPEAIVFFFPYTADQIIFVSSIASTNIDPEHSVRSATVLATQGVSSCALSLCQGKLEDVSRSVKPFSLGNLRGLYGHLNQLFWSFSRTNDVG